jgi:2,3-bisphosphoglycerate-independent phosphoglycerate mutase
MAKRPKPIALIILDGWGYREDPDDNAILAASTPEWDRLWNECPHTLIHASGATVGLPGEQMGNSEVGHLNLGSGRVVYQEFTRVNRSIRTGSFFSNHTLLRAVKQAAETDKALHVFGLLSRGGVHSHEDHIHAMIKMALDNGVSKVYLHASLDGRDTPPKSAEESIALMEEKFIEYGGGCFASVVGRFYSMDRDHRWPRVEAAYDLITQGKGEYQSETALEALEASYARDETDEFVKASAIVPAGEAPVVMEDGDVVVSMNFRSDRARQLTRAFTEPDFDGFERKLVPKLGSYTSLTEYNREFDVPIAFPPERLPNVFGEYLSSKGMRQLRIAETEKYAHVTFFFNGGEEQPFEGEDRILIPSPQVATYDSQPEMNAPQLTDQLVGAIESGLYDAIICNFANADMVGHTGDFSAAVKAVESLDVCLGRVRQSLHKIGGEMLVTADHGNAEQMRGEGTGQPHTAHTTNPVPLVYVGREAYFSEPGGGLSDVIPTMLALMELDQPIEMTGKCLLSMGGGPKAVG